LRPFVKEERKKTIVDSPTIQMGRDSIKVSDKLLPNSLPKAATSSVKNEDKVDTHVFSQQITASKLAFNDLDSSSSIDIEDHVDVTLIYEVKEVFAEGAQGAIHKARDKHLLREVVVKKLKENTMRRPFVKEAQLTAQLDHPAIIPIYSLNSSSEDEIYFAMKKVNGVTLREYLDRVCDHYYFKGYDQNVENSSLNTRLEQFIKICEAVQYAHLKKVIHRDLKPDNVMIGESREVYVMDWGIAYCFDDPENQRPEVIEHMKHNICGSPGYIDPQLVCNPFPDEPTDVYSLGMILYEVCTLQRGFSGFNTNELFEQAIRNQFPEVKHRFSKGVIAPELKSIIEKARNPNLLFRYRSVEELSEDIRRYLRNDEVSSLPDKPARKVMRWAQKNPYRMTVIMLTIIISLSSIAIFSLVQQNKMITEARARENTFADIQSRVANKAHVIDNQLTKLEQLLSRLSASILSLPEIRNEGVKLYSSADFLNAKTKPKETIYSSIFGKEVSVNSLVYHLAPKTDFDEVENYLSYLFSFKDEFLQIMLKSELNSPSHISKKDINEEKILLKPLPVRWIYCGLENGVFVSYPGKGGYPDEYDHRKRPWYKESKGKRGIVWAKPYYDINGLGLVMPCTISLYNQEDEFRGVLAFDLTIDYIASQMMLTDSEYRHKALLESVILNDLGEVMVSSALLKKNKKTNAMINSSIKRLHYSNKEVLAAVKKKKSTVFSVEENSGHYIYAINHIPTLNWYYVEKYDANQCLLNEH